MDLITQQLLMVAAGNQGTPPGELTYGTGSHTFTPGAGVVSVSVCCIGSGSNVFYLKGSGGLAWASNVTVTPGNNYTVNVGDGNNRTGSYFVHNAYVFGATTSQYQTGGTYTVQAGLGSTRGGGNGGNITVGGGYEGGSGAAGYTGKGGNGGSSGGQGFGSNGGGVGIVVKGPSGNGGGNGQPGAGGGGGGGGGHQQQGTGQPGSGGGYAWGGRMFGTYGPGGVRIIWPGDTRTYPNNSS